MNKSLFTTILGLLFAVQAFAQKDPAALRILDAMSVKYKSIPAFSADFSYIMENEEEGIDERFDGKIKVKDQKYRLQMSGQEIINDGVTVWAYLKDDNEVTISEYEEDEEEISISNIFTIYKEGYKYLFLNDLSTSTLNVVDLVPDDRDKSYYKIRMEIKKADNMLQSFRVFDKSGSRYLYQINSFETNSALTDADFSFDEKKYPGVEVIDFR